MATAKGKITASNIEAGQTVVRIVFASNFDGGMEWMPARIKRDSKLALVLENVPLGNGRRKIVTKFGEFVVVGHQTFILAKDGETAEEPEPVLPAETVETPAEEKVDAAAVREADAMRGDAEIVTVERNLTEARSLMQAEANRVITEAAKDIENLPHEIRFILNEDLNSARIQADSGEFANAAFTADRVSQKAGKFREVLATIEESGRAIAELNLPSSDAEKVKREFENARSFLTTHSPWEAGRLAKRSAEMWARVVRLREQFEDAPEWRKERITAALATMGTVVYPEGTPEHAAYREALTEALGEFKNGPKRWRITFERVGMYRNVPAFEYNAGETEESVAARLRTHLRPYLISSSFAFSFEDKTLLIEGGRFGRGTAAPIS